MYLFDSEDNSTMVSFNYRVTMQNPSPSWVLTRLAHSILLKFTFKHHEIPDAKKSNFLMVCILTKMLQLG